MPQLQPVQPLPPSGHDIPEAEGTSFADLFRAIAKGKWFILICTVICVVASIIYTSTTTPIYEAAGTVRIDPSRSGSLGLTDALMGGDSDVIPTEIGMLGSDQVALAALEMLTPEEFQQFAGFPKSEMSFSEEDAQQRPVPLTPRQAGAVDRFKGSVKASQVAGTQLVTISFRGPNPKLAAVLANHAVDAFMRKDFESRYSSVAQVQNWLSAKMQDLRNRAADAQSKLVQFQESNNLVGTDPTNNTEMDRLRDLNSDVTKAEGDRIVKEALVRAAQTGDPAVLASMTTDPNLTALQATEAALYTQAVQLEAKFGENYPPLIETRSQLAKVRLEIKNNISIITSRLQQDLSASKNTEDMLRQAYEKALTQAYALNRKQADYAVLVAEGGSSRDLYNTLEYKLQQATVNAGLNAINTMIVDRARTPTVPILPKKGLILVSALILGLAAGVGAALLKEAMGGEIQTLAQLESSTGLASLAIVPHMDVSDRKSQTAPATGQTKRLVTISDPRSRYAEAYRTLRNSVLLSSIDNPPRIVLISSSLPREGKSSTSINYAVVLAQKGARVLVLDADLRRPRLHVDFNVSNVNGISDWLIDRADSTSVISPIEDLPNLHFIPSGPSTAFPGEALASQKFQMLLEQWKGEYDNVLIDSAPLLVVSDSLPLARIADATVLVVRAGFTPESAVKRVKSILLRAHARIVGVVLNDSTIGQDTGYYGKNSYGYYE
ncbi:MAG: polysaccharide biosynthesis tyrosine autokinase [Edaphobacter sp.]|uniref:GumC family protein n=1 Tax=Edaphobacter sp. TaxID=1934404 RepID=UPI0023871CFB|nr:polysaccharide biosynthesis tyrosine autokinase [Edaphobacter sp.]MDE1178853.1 polysaccharide biosynthesis tyrosine autokinase [Edaphobacter sp.]